MVIPDDGTQDGHIDEPEDDRRQPDLHERILRVKLQQVRLVEPPGLCGQPRAEQQREVASFHSNVRQQDGQKDQIPEKVLRCRHFVECHERER